jgi:hypothetical protein
MLNRMPALVGLLDGEVTVPVVELSDVVAAPLVAAPVVAVPVVFVLSAWSAL